MSRLTKKEKKLLNTVETSFLVISLIIFISLTILVITNNVKWLDDIVFDLISNLRCDFLTIVFKGITFFCSIEFILIFTLGMLIFFKRNGKRFTINVIGCVLVNQLLKHLFVRSRPIDINLVTESGYSFPSGHSMMSVAFYGYFIYLILHSNMERWKKILYSVLLIILILLIGISRIYLGVHYASDVLGGFALSLTYLILFINLICKKKES